MASTDTTPPAYRIGTRYRINRLDQDYDALVIGSGMGGMTAAACLAKAGKKVLVLEQHYTAGGFTHTFQRAGYEWDVGLHYVGNMNHPDASGKKLMDYISNGQLQWADMDSHYDRIFLGDRHYDLVAGTNNCKAELLKHFPDEEKALDQYFTALEQIRLGVSLIAMEKALPPAAGLPVYLLRRCIQGKNFRRTTRQVLESITDNQTLIAVLCGQWGDNGMPPAESSFVIHSMIARHYMQGACYPVGGSAMIAKSIIPVIEAAGGKVMTYACVSEILLEKGRACGVIMADGHTIRAPVVISNAGIFNTFTRLLPQSVSKRTGYLRKMQNVERSVASICLYIGLDASAETLKLPKTNFWVYPSADYEKDIERFEQNPQQSPIPLIYISFPSAKDPDFCNRYPDKATIEIVAPGPYEWYRQWHDKPWGKRGDDYLAFKEMWSQRLLQELLKKMPWLQDHIDYYELSTPLSTDHFCRYSEGEIYGLSHNPARFDQHWLKPRTRIPGLFLTGQDIMSCGIMGAGVGGVLTAASVMGGKGMKLVKDLLA